MAKNTNNRGCAGCANIAHCRQVPSNLKEDGISVCHVVAKPPLSESAARNRYGDGGNLNGSPSCFGALLRAKDCR